MRQLLILALLASTAGCGGSAKMAMPSAYAQSESSSFGRSMSKKQSAPSQYAQQQRQQYRPQKGKAEADADAPEPEKPLIVYRGFLKLRVKRLLEAVDEITKITQGAGGYVESLAARVVVIRIPAGDFDKVMETFAAVGQLLDRQVKALDVTAQFTDLQGRLDVAKQTRERLLKLLEQAKKAEERLRILQEIQRLTEQIESIESTLSTLQNLVDFFTITIELEPVVESRRTVAHRSAFEWVRQLKPHLVTLEEGSDELGMKLPAGFVLFDEDDTYRAQAADTSVLRGGRVDNEPRGDNDFWAAAVHHELDGRDEELVQDGTAGEVAYRLYRNKDIQPRYYLVGVHAAGEHLYVVEVFYPNQPAYDRHHGAVIQALQTFKVQ